MPIPAAPTPAPVTAWSWLDADPVLAARVDKYVQGGKFASRDDALRHALRIYLKVR